MKKEEINKCLNLLAKDLFNDYTIRCASTDYYGYDTELTIYEEISKDDKNVVIKFLKDTNCGFEINRNDNSITFLIRYNV